LPHKQHAQEDHHRDQCGGGGASDGAGDGVHARGDPGFARVDLEAGHSRRVRFRVAATQLGYTNLVRDFTVEPARVEVYLGLDSHDRQLESAFELTGAPRPLASAERSFFSEVEVADV